MRKEYILDEQAQEHLKRGMDSLYQAMALLEFMATAQGVKENNEEITAINGILALMNNGLDNLAEV